MSKNNIIRPYVHSPPTKELAPPQKKHKKPIPSASMPLISLSPAHQPTLPVSIPTTSSVSVTAPLPPIDTMNSCPTLASRRSSASSPYPPLPALYSLPEFKVGSLPLQRLSAWPVAMTNDFLTPSSNRSFSLSYPSSSSDDDDDDQPLVFSMDDYI
ncbi:unnamed protein product [Absidia cylindrospora]